MCIRDRIFPGDFIEIFERTGLIYRLDRFIWELAVQQLAKWQKEGRDELYISVNISTKDFQYMDVYQTITSLVERYGIIPVSYTHLDVYKRQDLLRGRGYVLCDLWCDEFHECPLF